VTKSNGSARIISTDGGNIGVYQDVLNETNQKWYTVTFTIAEITSGSLRVQNTGGYSKSFTSPGTYTETIQATGGSGVLEFKRNTGVTDIVIDDIVVVEEEV